MRGARALERLRQERETFEVRKSQSRWWFGLRFATVSVLLAIAVGIFLLGAWVLLSPGRYSPAVMTACGIAMMLDLLAIAGATFTNILPPAAQPAFGPVTTEPD